MTQKANQPEQLIRDLPSTDPTTLTDLLLVMAKNVEDAILETGSAVPGVDYTLRDLFMLAQPFALNVWKNSKNKVTFTTSWPV